MDLLRKLATPKKPIHKIGFDLKRQCLEDMDFLTGFIRYLREEEPEGFDIEEWRVNIKRYLRVMGSVSRELKERIERREMYPVAFSIAYKKLRKEYNYFFD